MSWRQRFISPNSTEEIMKATNRFWRYLAMPIGFVGMLSISSAAELNPAAVIYKLPDQIPWSPVDARGAQNAVVVGDPTKPGFYAVYTKWTKGNHFSRPHFHPNDRYIVVLQGTWWVGSGPKFDPEKGGEHVTADERFFLVRTGDISLSRDGWIAQEADIMTDHKWWSRDELAQTSETVWPENLATMLDAAMNP
jgi:hypothetical protein